MRYVRNQLKNGFLTRIQFRKEYATQFSVTGAEVVEVIYPDDEDIFEFANFLEEYDQYIVTSLVWFANGRIYSGKTFPLKAES